MRTKKHTVSSLQEQCQKYLVLNLDQYCTDTLVLLPVRVRSALLRTMSLADVCRVEKTTFVSGTDMEAVWEELYLSTMATADKHHLIFPFHHKAAVNHREQTQRIVTFLVLHQSWPYTRFPLPVLLFGVRTETSSLNIRLPHRYTCYDSSMLLQKYSVGLLLEMYLTAFLALPKHVYLSPSYFKHGCFWREEHRHLLQMFSSNVQRLSATILTDEDESIVCDVVRTLVSAGHCTLQSLFFDIRVQPD